MLLPTAFSLYISAAIVCPCTIVVGHSWFGRTGPSVKPLKWTVTALPVTTTGLDWTEAQIGDSS